MVSPRVAAVAALLVCWHSSDVAGQRRSAAPHLMYPNGLALDGEGSLYISDIGTHQILKLVHGTLTVVAGTGMGGFSGDDGPAARAQLFAPHGLAFDADGRLLVADTFNHRVRRIAPNGVIPGEDRTRYGSSALGNSLILARNLLEADAGTRFILASHGGWDHHSDIYKEKTRNHQVLIRELDRALGNLIKDLDSTPSRHNVGRTLLDDTLVIAMSEFGRVPGPITETRKGREHHIPVHAGIFAGGGIRRGAVIGRTDEPGGAIADAGWSARRAIYMEDVACTIYSALGIDWTKQVQNTPSGRAFHYVEPASGTKYVGFKPVQELFA